MIDMIRQSRNMPISSELEPVMLCQMSLSIPPGAGANTTPAIDADRYEQPCICREYSQHHI